MIVLIDESEYNVLSMLHHHHHHHDIPLSIILHAPAWLHHSLLLLLQKYPLHIYLRSWNPLPHNFDIKRALLPQTQHGRPNPLNTHTIPPHRQPTQPRNLPPTSIHQHTHNLLNPPLTRILDTNLLRLSGQIFPLDVRMVSVARLDDDLDGGVGGGEVDEVVGGGGFLEVGANGGGGAAVFAVPDAQFLELLDASCCHDCCINIIYIVLLYCCDYWSAILWCNGDIN
mmetsp:Transcript_29259/g.44251  ORF Transcript_29259/g.44251 Transcript_29259/m.44251 type:complete len:227 (-) Transcript_29259:43-723(-)